MVNGYIYAYVFEEHNAVYVGWTTNTVRRDHQHRKYQSVRQQRLYRFVNDNLIELPQMKILYEASSKEYQYGIEEMFIRSFENNGWYVLNVDKGYGANNMHKLAHLDVCMSFVDGIVYSQRPIRIKTKQNKKGPAE